jgi:protocatechuate 3,4-dioxygenase beta subunit
MKPDTISPRRRQLIVGSLAAMPMSALASQAGNAAVTAASHPGQLVVSGRILAADGRPVFGALVEVLRAGSDATATTDADGRFMVTTTASTRIRYRVSHKDHETRVEQLNLVQDGAGTWRGTFGLALA